MQLHRLRSIFDAVMNLGYAKRTIFAVQAKINTNDLVTVMRRKHPPKETSRPKQQIKMRRAAAHLMSESGCCCQGYKGSEGANVEDGDD